MVLWKVALVEDAELGTLLAELVEVKSESGGVGDVRTAGGEGLADGTQDAAAASVMAVVVVAYAIAGNEIGLVLDGSGTGQDLESVLAALGPVGNTDDGIELEIVGITAPHGETQVVAGDQQQAEAHILHNGVALACRIVAVFVAIGKQMVLIIIFYFVVSAINKIVPVPEGALGFDGQAATDGTLTVTGGTAHPLQ